MGHLRAAIAFVLAVSLLCALAVWDHSRPHCTYADRDVDPHFESVEQQNEWLNATRPAIEACPNGGWDKSKIDWSQVPWMTPF